MEINSFILKKMSAPPTLIALVDEKYKGDIPLLKVMNDEGIDFGSLHWLNMTFNLDEKEQALYWDKVKIKNSKGCFCSDNVKESEVILNSSFITNSKKINHSSHIENSQQVINSNTVNNSVNIFSSNFIFNSQDILSSNNVTNCKNIVSGTAITNCEDIFMSQNIRKSKQIFRCNNLKFCAFCAWSEKLNNSMFCVEQQKQDYMLFNKKVEPEVIEQTMQQYNMLMTSHLRYFKDTDLNYLFSVPEVCLKFNEHYIGIDKRFWDWAKTLPNYDEDIIERITLNYMN